MSKINSFDFMLIALNNSKICQVLEKMQVPSILLNLNRNVFIFFLNKVHSHSHCNLGYQFPSLIMGCNYIKAELLISKCYEMNNLMNLSRLYYIYY